MNGGGKFGTGAGEQRKPLKQKEENILRQIHNNREDYYMQQHYAGGEGKF